MKSLTVKIMSMSIVMGAAHAATLVEFAAWGVTTPGGSAGSGTTSGATQFSDLSSTTWTSVGSQTAGVSPSERVATYDSFLDGFGTNFQSSWGTNITTTNLSYYQATYDLSIVSATVTKTAFRIGDIDTTRYATPIITMKFYDTSGSIIPYSNITATTVAGSNQAVVSSGDAGGGATNVGFSGTLGTVEFTAKTGFIGGVSWTQYDTGNNPTVLQGDEIVSQWVRTVETAAIPEPASTLLLAFGGLGLLLRRRR